MKRYHGLEEFERDFSYFNSQSCSQPEGFKLFLVGESADTRLTACNRVKKVLEEMLGEAQGKGKIKRSEVVVIDISAGRKKDVNDILFSPIWQLSGNSGGEVYLPIYHNADEYNWLPQVAFDGKKPGIFSVSQQGYDSVQNVSKRACYDVVALD